MWHFLPILALLRCFGFRTGLFLVAIQLPTIETKGLPRGWRNVASSRGSRVSRPWMNLGLGASAWEREANVSNLVLTRTAGGWQGPAPAGVTVKVQSLNPNVVMEGAVCSSSNPPDLPINDGKAVFTLAKGPQVLTVAIKPLTPPFANWAVLEVDDAGNSQKLDEVLIIEDPADPFSININIMGL